MMKLVKQIALYVSSYLVHILLFATVTLGVFVILVSNPLTIKRALIDSSAYDKFIPAIIKSNSAAQNSNAIPLNDEKVLEIIQDSFPADKLKVSSEMVIDGVYDWLNNKTETVNFSIDFTLNKADLGNSLASYAFSRLAAQPDCTLQPIEFNPFVDTCKPAGVDFASEQSKLAQLIKTDEGFLKETILSGSNLPKGRDGKTIVERFSGAPQIYGWLTVLPWLLGGLTIASIATIIFLSPRRLLAWQWLGKTLVTTSITIIITPVIFGYILPNITDAYRTELGGTSSESLINDAILIVSKQIDVLLILAGLLLAVCGLTILFFSKIAVRRRGYSIVAAKSGLLTSIGPKKTAANTKKITEETVPLQSSEISVTKKPKKRKKSQKYRKIPLE